MGLFFNSAIANESQRQDAVTSATPQLAEDQVVITGKVICLGCSLKKEKGAKAQCSIYGHTNALLIQKIYNAQGKGLKEVIGATYHFLHNDQSNDLIVEHSYLNKTVVITGKIYPAAQIIEVHYVKTLD